MWYCVIVERMLVDGARIVDVIRSYILTCVDVVPEKSPSRPCMARAQRILVFMMVTIAY